uniref:Uncharacterized protein n=1 Tax=Glossina brevipalpis TaxID=37001 RepID=A0A1A9X1S6_9MUSC
MAEGRIVIYQRGKSTFQHLLNNNYQYVHPAWSTFWILFVLLNPVLPERYFAFRVLRTFILLVVFQSRLLRLDRITTVTVLRDFAYTLIWLPKETTEPRNSK